MLGLTSGRDFFAVKGVLERMLERLHITATLSAQPLPPDAGWLDTHQSCQLRLNDELWGYVGLVSAAAQKAFSLRRATVVAEIRLELLDRWANLVPTYRPISPFPSIEYDVNLVVPETVRWSNLSDTIQQAGGTWLERVEYRETYRNPDRDGAGFKRLLFSIAFRSLTGTLTGAQAESLRAQIVAACQQRHGARLLQ